MATADQLNDLRSRILAGEEPEREELRAAIKSLTGDRIAAQEATAKKGAKRAPAVKVDLDDLL